MSQDFLEEHIKRTALLYENEEAKAYKKYNEEIGGEPIGLMMPSGYPKGVEEMGGPIKVYEECLRKNVTWETLLDYKELPSDVVI